MQLSVEGMTCAHCERTITRAIEALGGRARVDLAAGTVAIEGLADEAAVRDAIEAEGYTVTGTGGPAAGTCCGGGCHG
jgi:copper chaperone